MFWDKKKYKKGGVTTSWVDPSLSAQSLFFCFVHLPGDVDDTEHCHELGINRINQIYDSHGSPPFSFFSLHLSVCDIVYDVIGPPCEDKTRDEGIQEGGIFREYEYREDENSGDDSREHRRQDEFDVEVEGV